VILASLAYGFFVPLAGVHVEGIRGLSELDIQYALDLGYRLKLLAVIKRSGSRVEVRVHPAMVPLSHMLASVGGVFNAVMVQGDLAGNTLYYGRGAGRLPTASTVIGDLADIARNLVGGAPRRFKALPRTSSRIRLMEMGDVETRYYLRLSLLDRPGMLARITSVLGAQDISIASVLQKEASSGEHVPVVIVTHRARERRVAAAIRDIDALDIVGSRTVKLRIED
jgi:homoserine dehydrogenase